MQQSEFERLIKESEEDLQRIRKKYFPLIERRIITGYNLYLEQFDYSKGNLFLNYLHSDLKPQDRHFQELSEILKSEGFLEERMLINNELVDRQEVLERDADYITEPYWDDPLGMRYFTLKGKELSQEKAEVFRRRIVGESLQYDLLLRVKDEKELRKLVDLFKKYASKLQIDKKGRIFLRNEDPIINPNFIHDSWKIPLLVCATNDNKKPGDLNDFLMVNQFNISERLGDKNIILSTFVRAKTKDLRNILREEVNYSTNKRYALRAFVEYIDGIET